MSTPRLRKLAGALALFGTLLLPSATVIGQTSFKTTISADGTMAVSDQGTIQQDPITSTANTVDPIIIQNPITTTPSPDTGSDPNAIPFIETITKVSADGTSAATFATSLSLNAFAPTQYIVKFKKGAKREYLAGSKKKRGYAKHPDIELVDVPAGLTVKEALRRHKQNPNVDYVEPDYIVRTSATLPSDPEWLRQWDMTKIAADVAWDTQTNAGSIVVAVIDSGIDYTHPDLAANIWTNPVDLVSHGYTCIGGPCTVGGVDDYGHGTHVAGTIGAVGNNGVGMAGINWQVKLLSLKFTNAAGQGLTSDAIHAFEQVLALKQAGVNIRVTNNSWGGAGPSQALKDVMLAVEAAGIVNVAAAGNSNANVDATPDYPGSFDNRGLISVIATDASDLGASFSNSGLANTDIAAPGVSTLSTVPSNGCTLCDPTGYRLLSGTSMAAPHVAGVVAALLQQRPNLTPAEVRDIILDPASVDPTFNAKGQASSSGGRLNMVKALANPRLAAPIVLNNFPSLSLGPDVYTGAGGFVALSFTPNDPDIADLANLRTAQARQLPVLENWLLGAMLGQLYPAPAGSATNFTAPSMARLATVPYLTSVADNRGGGASAANYVTTDASLTTGSAPTGTITVSNANPLVGEVITVTHGVTDPDAGQVLWGISAFYNGTGNSTCCFSTASTNLSFPTPRVVRIKTQTIDRELNLSNAPSVVVRVGGATGEPPLAKGVFDKQSGPVPLTVNVDMSSSVAGSAAIQSYAIFCESGQAPISTTAQGSCTFTKPGARWIQMMVVDTAGQTDMSWAYVVATPASVPADVTPPTVAVTSPGEATNVGGAVSLAASASDASGIMKVEFRLDAPTGALLGTATGAPFAVTWDAAGITTGAHQIYAVVTDGAGNSAVSAARNITVGDAIVPTVSLTSPAAGNVSGTVTLSASASDASGIARVDYRLDSPTGTLLGSSTTGPAYSVAWNVTTTTAGAHTLYAIATDNAGNVGSSAAVAINVVTDVTAPTVSIASPTSGSTVRGFVTITANAADAGSGVASVEYRLGSATGAVIGTATAAPWAVDWDTRPYAGSNRTIYARATDKAGNVATSAGVTVSVRTDTTAPTLSAITVSPDPTLGGVAVFDAPLNRLEVRGYVLLSTNASDSSGIARVEYRLDSTTGALLGTATVGSPYVVSWNSTTVTLGNHTLYALAYDRVGNLRTTSLAIVVRASDVTLPVVSVTSPTAGSTVQNTVTLTATASDASGIASVEYRLDSPTGTVLGSSNLGPNYSVGWNSASATAGAHTIYARATDGAGNVGVSTAVGITVAAGDATAPTVSVTSPAAGSTVIGVVTLTASASDASGIASVTYRLDSPTGTVLGTSTTGPNYSVSWDSSTSVGARTIYAIATDGVGNTGTSAAVAINVTSATGNALPTAAFSFPTANGVRFSANFTATGTAADSDGNVAKVEYRIDTGAWATATGTTSWSAPINIAPLSRSTHTITVRVTDNAGGVTTISRTFRKG